MPAGWWGIEHRAAPDAQQRREAEQEAGEELRALDVEDELHVLIIRRLVPRKRDAKHQHAVEALTRMPVWQQREHDDEECIDGAQA